jgi:hypothetical protein
VLQRSALVENPARMASDTSMERRDGNRHRQVRSCGIPGAEPGLALSAFRQPWWLRDAAGRGRPSSVLTSAPARSAYAGGVRRRHPAADHVSAGFGAARAALSPYSAR